MQRNYEVMFIVRPDIAEEELDRLISTLEGQVSATGATVKHIDRSWGKRRLAYLVRKFREGIYVLFTIESASGEVVHELERRLRVTEPVIKFQTVRIDEAQKRLEKIRKYRELHQRAKPSAPLGVPETTPETAPAIAVETAVEPPAEASVAESAAAEPPEPVPAEEAQQQEVS